VPIYCAAVRLERRNRNSDPNPEFRPLMISSCYDQQEVTVVVITIAIIGLKIGAPVTPTLGNVHANLGFYTPFCFRVRSPYGTDGQTDGQDLYCGPLGRLLQPKTTVAASAIYICVMFVFCVCFCTVFFLLALTFYCVFLHVLPSDVIKID